MKSQTAPTMFTISRAGRLALLFVIGLLTEKPASALDNRGIEIVDPYVTGSSDGDSSFFHFFSIGESNYIKPDMLALARIPVNEGYSMGNNPSTFEQNFDSFYMSDLRSNFAVVNLTVNSPTINSYLLNPASLSVKRFTNAEVIERDGSIRQVLTANTLADVITLTDGTYTPPLSPTAPLDYDLIDSAIRGYHVKVYDRKVVQPKNSNGLHTILANSVPLVEWIMRTPDGGPFINVLESIIIDRRNSGPANVVFRRFTWDFDADRSAKVTYTGSLDAGGLPVLGELVEFEDIVYMNRGERPNDFTMVRELRRITTTAEGPQWGTEPQVVSRRLQEFRDFSPDESGDMNAYKRMIREVEGYGDDDGLETTYTFYDDPSKPMVYGRLKSKRSPGGNWELYQYNDSEGAAVYEQTKYSAWRDSSFGEEPDGSLAQLSTSRKEVVSVASTTNLTRTVSYGDVMFSRELFTSYLGAGGELNNNLIVQNSQNAIVSVRTWTLNPATANTVSAGRMRWMENPDGTAEIHSLTPVPAGGYTCVSRRGAGSRFGVTDGLQISNTYSPFIEAFNETVTDTTVPSLDTWAASTVDLLGRPTRIDRSGEYMTFQYAWYGLARKRDFDGTVTTWECDPLKRGYLQRHFKTESDTVPYSVISFGYEGLTTTEIRDGYLLRTTTRKINGEIESTERPDGNGNGQPDVTNYLTAYPETGGKIVTITRPDGAMEVRTHYRDGLLKSVARTTGPTLNYTYGIQSPAPSSLWTQISTVSTEPNKNGIEKTYADALGRHVRTEYQSALNAWAVKTVSSDYHPVSAANGARTKLANRMAIDGLSTAYTYNVKGDLATVAESLPGGGSRTTQISQTPVNETGLGNCLRYSGQEIGGVASTLLTSVDGRFKKTLFYAADASLLGTSIMTRTPYEYRPKSHNDGRPAAWHPGITNLLEPMDVSGRTGR